jgi:hypothetical protein
MKAQGFIILISVIHCLKPFPGCGSLMPLQSARNFPGAHKRYSIFRLLSQHIQACQYFQHGLVQNLEKPSQGFRY